MYQIETKIPAPSVVVSQTSATETIVQATEMHQSRATLSPPNVVLPKTSVKESGVDAAETRT